MAISSLLRQHNLISCCIGNPCYSKLVLVKTDPRVFPAEHKTLSQFFFGKIKQGSSFIHSIRKCFYLCCIYLLQRLFNLQKVSGSHRSQISIHTLHWCNKWNNSIKMLMKCLSFSEYTTQTCSHGINRKTVIKNSSITDCSSTDLCFLPVQ